METVSQIKKILIIITVKDESYETIAVANYEFKLVDSRLDDRCEIRMLDGRTIQWPYNGNDEIDLIIVMGKIIRSVSYEALQRTRALHKGAYYNARNNITQLVMHWSEFNLRKHND